MPGENCAIFGCSTSRRHKDISIFKVPLPNSDFNKTWGEKLINIITKDRVIDKQLRKRIDTFKLYICERHFSPDQFYVYPTRKSLKEGEIPYLNLPKKSFQTVTISSESRSTTSIKKKREEFLVFQDLSPPPSPSTIYRSFSDFKQRIVKLSLSKSWHDDVQDTLVIVTCFTTDHILPKYEVFIDQSLAFSVRVYGWMLPDDHVFYSLYNRTFYNITLKFYF